jgi:hypothetical protein
VPGREAVAVNSVIIPHQSAMGPSIIVPPSMLNMRGMRGASKWAPSRAELEMLGIIPGIAGGSRGTNTAGDVVTQTADGRDLNDLWDEFIASVALQNADRQRIIDLLTFPVTSLIEDVPQFATEDFEEATEFGVPKGMRAIESVFQMAYTFKWYDSAIRYTWMFLAEADQRQVQAINATMLDADNRNVFSGVMKTLFNNVNLGATIKGQNYTVFKLYNADGTVPPAYKNTTFNGSHNHYLATGAATVDSGDLDDMYAHLKHHGYGIENGSTVFVMVNSAQSAAIRTFRVSTGSSYDFVPSLGQPGMYLPINTDLLGQGQIANTFRGMNVIGNYGPVIVCEEDYVPPGYMAMIASGGQANLNNVVGIREHVQPALRGLRIVKGPNPDYPIVNSYYSRGFGTGIRQRGAAVISQITTNGSYAPPAVYA